jgi:ubiquinone biosynthesis protein
MGKQIKELPRYVHDILRQTARGRQRIEIRHSGLERFDQKLEKGGNRLTVGLIISASIIAGSLVLNSSQKVIELQLNFLGGQTVSLTALLGLVGYSIATVLGVWLIFSIFRSGKM